MATPLWERNASGSLAAVLQRYRGNTREAAAVLGIDRSTLYEKIKNYEVPRQPTGAF